MKKRKCKCTICSDRRAVKSQADAEEQMLIQYGFYVHWEPHGNWINFHTHGIEEKWNHPELQIVLKMKVSVATNIFFAVVQRIRNGEKFEDGQEVVDVIKSGYNIRFFATKEADRNVLRIIIPDTKKCVAPDDIAKAYKWQYEVET